MSKANPEDPVFVLVRVWLQYGRCRHVGGALYSIKAHEMVDPSERGVFNQTIFADLRKGNYQANTTLESQEILDILNTAETAFNDYCTNQTLFFDMPRARGLRSTSENHNMSRSLIPLSDMLPQGVEECPYYQIYDLERFEIENLTQLLINLEKKFEAPDTNDQKDHLCQEPQTFSLKKVSKAATPKISKAATPTPKVATKKSKETNDSLSPKRSKKTRYDSIDLSNDNLVDFENHENPNSIIPPKANITYTQSQVDDMIKASTAKFTQTPLPPKAIITYTQTQVDEMMASAAAKFAQTPVSPKPIITYTQSQVDDMIMASTAKFAQANEFDLSRRGKTKMVNSIADYHRTAGVQLAQASERDSFERQLASLERMRNNQLLERSLFGYYQNG